MPQRSFTGKFASLLAHPGTMVIAAFLVRYGIFYYIRSHPPLPVSETFQIGAETGRLAEALAAGKGFSSPLNVHSGPSAWMTPVFPLLLAGVFKLFGTFSWTSYLVIVAIDCLFSSLTAWSVYAIARKAFGIYVGVAAGWLWTVLLNSVLYSINWVWDTALSALVFSLLFLATLHLGSSKRSAAWAGYGALWGVGAMINASIVSTMPFLLGWSALQLRQKFLPSLRLVLIALLLFTVVISPWIIRNYVVFHKIILFRDNLGLELWLGNNPSNPGIWSGWLHPNNDKGEQKLFLKMGEIAFMEQKQREALSWIRTHPGAFLYDSWHRFVANWTGSDEPIMDMIHGPLLNTIFDFLGVLFPLLTFLGALLAYRQRNPCAFPLAASLLFFPLVYYVTHTSLRYREPIDPLMTVLTAFSLVTLFSKIPLLLPGINRERPGPGAAQEIAPASNNFGGLPLGLCRGDETEFAAGGTGDSHGPASVRRARWLFPLIAVLLIAAAYARAPFLGFVFDDNFIVKANPYITSVRHIPSYFTEHIWSNLVLTHKNYYRPVFLLWLLGNYKTFGTDPLGWHLSSLLLHLGSALMLYLLALRLIRQRFAALAASLFFGLHPLQVENVVWASASTELLGTFLALAAMLCYLRSLEVTARRLLLLATSVFLYALAVMAKETAIILPAIIFLHEWLGRPASLAPLVRRPRAAAFLPALRESLPFGVTAIAYVAARVAVLGGVGTTVVQMTRRVWMLTIPSILQAYLVHVVWPARLSAFYDYPYITEFSVRSVLLPSAMLLALALLLFAAIRKTPGAQLAVAWMVLPLLPALDIPVFPRGEILHDRYFYHPLVGLSLLVGFGLAALARRCTAPAPRMALYSSAAAVALLLGIATFHQTAFWTDDFALFSRGVAVAPHSGFANNNLGALLLSRGQWDEAMADFRKAVEHSPDFYLAHYDMGLAYYRVGRFSEAEACFKRALALAPEDPESNLSLGMTYFRTGRLPLAIEYVRKAIVLKPSGAGYHFALGVMLKQGGDFRGARAEFLEELKRDPRHQPSLDQLSELDRHPVPAVAAK